MSGLQVIIVGGGLSGLSTAHTVLEHGGRVLLLEKMPFPGGNSTKATSGINGALTRTQIAKGIPDSVEKFEKDTARSAALGDEKAPIFPLCEVLCEESAPAVEWLIKAFGLDLSLISRLGGHSEPRTHRGKERFPGMTITYALMEKLDEIAAKAPNLARVITKAKVTKLLTQGREVIGVEYEREGQKLVEYGPVVMCTGGFGADFTQGSLLQKYRPDLGHLPTTNGEWCTGDGIKMSQDIGADVVDMEWVQVHPTGLVHPSEPEAKVKFLAAEALRGVGGILLDANGNRFCDELGRRDYVTGLMWKNKGPFRLILNSKASKEIEWHCKHYVGRGLMKFYGKGEELAKDMGITKQKLEDTFKTYNENARDKSCPFKKKFFTNAPFDINDEFNVSIVTPVVHYCMGGLKISPNGAIMDKEGEIPGLYASGEVCGGIHGKNRLGGNSLLDCVVFGRVSGRNVAKFQFDKVLTTMESVNQLLKGSAPSRLQTLTAQVKPVTQTQQQQPAKQSDKTFSVSDVAKHNKDTDCWVILSGKVYDVTTFLKDHPGGKDAIMLFAGKDATEQFDMLHQPSVLDKFGPQYFVGKLA